jgi:hypothetical protein
MRVLCHSNQSLIRASDEFIRCTLLRFIYALLSVRFNDEPVSCEDANLIYFRSITIYLPSCSDGDNEYQLHLSWCLSDATQALEIIEMLGEYTK